MAVRRSTATAASAVSLTTTYTVTKLEVVPAECLLAWLHIQLTSIVSAANVVLYLAADSSGDHAITDELTVPIVVGATTSSDGGANVALDLPYATLPEGTEGDLWLVAKLDAGSATATPALVIEEVV